MTKTTKKELRPSLFVLVKCPRVKLVVGPRQAIVGGVDGHPR